MIRRTDLARVWPDTAGATTAAKARRLALLLVIGGGLARCSATQSTWVGGADGGGEDAGHADAAGSGMDATWPGANGPDGSSGTGSSSSGGPSSSSSGGAGSSGGSPDDASVGGSGSSSGGGSGIPPSCPVTGSVTAGAGSGSASTTIALDGAGSGRTFVGIGAISGGGGNSRLLFDYPDPQRSDILDYLFKPGYGAAISILKVEIGGDTQSTDGAEPSHMHTSGDLDCTRGYEWWLMQQAKARNPNIKLYALSWGAPGWFSGGFWSNDNVNYHISYLKCAKQNGLTIDYMGGWNERWHDKTWYENLHAAIAQNGFATKVVANDTDWSAADDMLSDPTFNAAVDVVSAHYPCNGMGAQTSCPSTANAVATGKPLFASENGSQDYNTGAPIMARENNLVYLDGKMTAVLNWPLVAAIVPHLAYETYGLLVANQPWSGWYDLGQQLWVTAHVGQFVQPGWTYIDKSSGFIGGNASNGSYVTLKSTPNSTNGSDYAVVVQTADASGPQTVAFQATGGLSTSDPHVWATNMGSSQSSDYFVHGADLTGTSGSYWVTLEPNYVYTITTTTGQCKGAAQSPASQPAQALPYSDNFEGYSGRSIPHFLSDQEGAFELASCGGGRSGVCLRQMAPVVPIPWATPGTPFTVVGTADWSDYTVTADVLLESRGSVEVMGRFSGIDYFGDAKVDAYYLSVSDTGAWSIFANNSRDGMHDTLASGTVSALGTGTWHTISLGLKGSSLTATIDGAMVGSANDSTIGSGLAGLSVGSASNSWLDAQFDNLSVAP